MWEQKLGKVDVTDDVVSSTIIFYFERNEIRFSVSDTQGDTTEKSSQESGQKGGQRLPQKNKRTIGTT